MAFRIRLVMDYNPDDAMQQRLRAHHHTRTPLDYTVTVPGASGKSWSFPAVVVKWDVHPGPVNGVPQLTIILESDAVITMS